MHMKLNEILGKNLLAQSIVQFDVYHPDIASHARAGQFVVVRKDDHAERIPLTIVDFDPSVGTIRLIIQEVGVSTKKLCAMDKGEAIRDILGPLGRPSEIKKFGTAVCVGGGVGIAPLYPVAKALKQAGNRVLSIIGARTKDLFILEQEMRAVSDELHLCTDDGSAGFRGFVSGKLAELIGSGIQMDRVWAIGPDVMMAAVVETTRPHAIPTIVSLNTLMVDGTGMCGGCRITVDGQTRFVCVDGPEFDGHQVKFDELLKRSKMYVSQEKRALQEHECKLNIH